MAYLYVDTDGAGATAPYGTWATAAQDLITAVNAASAGDTIFMQGAAKDTAASGRTITSPGTLKNPLKIIGVKDGTTNTDSSVATSDLVAKGDADQPHFEVTGGGNDLVIQGVASCYGIEFTTPDVFHIASDAYFWTFTQCVKNIGGVYHLNAGAITNYNCDVIGTSSSFGIWTRDNIIVQPLKMYGGTYDATSSTNPLCHSSLCEHGVLFQGVDLSSADSKNICGSASSGKFELINCKTHASTGLVSGIPSKPDFSIVAIGCSDTTSQGATTSIQDYEYEDPYGSIVTEATAVRTGGADDDASGVFSYAMTAHADSTLEGSSATLKSPWMTAWVTGGSTTITVYIANSSASTDYNEDEVFCEFYTPDAGDTAQDDQTFDPALARLLDSTTAITDDTGSTWGTGANNHQKLSITVTTGFEGAAKLRVHLAKRQASPDTLYIDPLPVVT